MRKNEASRTALLIAAAMVLLRHGASTWKLVSPATAELSDNILEKYSLGTRCLRRLLHQPLLAKVGSLLERLTIPGILRHYALRKKYLSRLAESALQEGAEQLILLGAGFDGCAVDLSRRYLTLACWEIDHPATQRWKKGILAGVDQSRFHLVPADLSAGNLPTTELAAQYLDPARRSFWIAEGLLMYLPETRVRSLLQAIVSLTAAGSAFAFTFMENSSGSRVCFRGQSRLVDWWLRRRGEPFLWSASRAEIGKLLGSSWSAVDFFDDRDFRRLGQVASTVALAAGETVCLATR